MEGPDQIVPSDVYTTTDITTPVKLRTGDNEMSRLPPRSLPTVMEAVVAANADRVALAFKNNPEDPGFQYITFREYHKLTKTVAKAFLKLGLKKFNSVVIIGFNSPEWFLSYLGCIHAGGVACGVYTTNSAEATFYCLQKSRAALVVVEDDTQVQKVLKYEDELPNLKAIIQYSEEPKSPKVMTWKDLIRIGEQEDESALNAALKAIAINECCTLIYTSGTTGNPKGVMLSHDNLIWNAQATININTPAEDERLISYLPLSHVAALLLDVYCHLLAPATIYFANKDALKGGLIKTLLEVRPTRFLGVPRIWEKISEKMKAAGTEAGVIKQCIVNWAKNQGLQKNLNLMKGIDSPSLGYIIARAMVFSKVKNKLGFDCCKSFWSGAAPLATDVKLYLASLDIPVLEAFGMSESSGVHTFSIITSFRFDSSGRTLPGAKTKLENPDAEKEGEICIYGRHVFMGYIDDEEETDQALDENGWLHSGDVGKVDKDGFLYITGRIKELLITAGGENISPVLIEQNIKAELPFLGQVVVICERRKFLSVLLTLSSEVDADTGEAKDELAPAVIKWLRDLGFAFTKTSQVIASGPDKKILSSIQKGIDAANEKAISNAQKIRKFAILPKDFSITTGELGPTLKLRRTTINGKYQDIINKFYED